MEDRAENVQTSKVEPADCLSIAVTTSIGCLASQVASSIHTYSKEKAPCSGECCGMEDFRGSGVKGPDSNYEPEFYGDIRVLPENSIDGAASSG